MSLWSPKKKMAESCGKMTQNRILEIFTLTSFICFWTFDVKASNPQISGGVDLRYLNQNGDKNFFRAEGLFLNFRKVFSDRKGDRVITVGQIDWDDNFDKLRPYQTFIQYKGPLGKWNLIAGHFILPFGLLSDYDTERLLLQTQELKTLGIKLDTGLKFFGHFRFFDYAISVTQGVGRKRLKDVDKNKLVTGRIGWEGNDLRMGLSVVNGKVLSEEDENNMPRHKKRSGFDLTKYLGPTTLRTELSWGRTNGNPIYGNYLGIDRALTSNIELNLKYAYRRADLTEHFLGLGFSYNFWERLYFRAANEYQFSKKDKNEFSIQIYWDFIKNL